MVAVCGPNGAGKSTLLAALAGEHPSCMASVQYGGVPISELTPRELSQQRVVLEQTPTLSAEFTLTELIDLGAPMGIAPNDLDELTRPILSVVGLADMRHRLVSELSGGQRHRAHLARVLTQLRGNRKLGHDCYLFLDEPTASLDIGQQTKILKSMRSLTKHGIGILVVLHDLNLAAAFADKVVLMNEGRVVYSDTAEATLTPERLSDTYGTPIMVEKLPGNQIVIQPRY